jgi:hypothetical protein
MANAERVHSTPPRNSSQDNPLSNGRAVEALKAPPASAAHDQAITAPAVKTRPRARIKRRAGPRRIIDAAFRSAWR